MERGFGSTVAEEHAREPHRKPARYLVVIDGGGSTVARLFLETRELVDEFDASTEEVAVMIKGLTPLRGANGPEWDRALAGHSVSERAAAAVYTLDV
jgi:hypothetical protein